MSSTFSVNFTEVATEALSQLGVLDESESISPAQLATCKRSVNIMLKSWVKKNWWLWTSVWVQIPLGIGVGSYTIGPTGTIVTDRPYRISGNSYLRWPDGRDVTLTLLARSDWDQIGVKTTPGTPNSFYYDRQLTNGVFYPWPIITLGGYTVFADCQRPIADIVGDLDPFDVPQELYDALVYGLAYRVGPKFNATRATLAEMKERMMVEIEEDADANQEEAVTTFSPSAFGSR